MKVGSGIPSHAEKEFCGELNPCVTKTFPSRICISSNLMLYATSWKVWLEREEYAFLIQVFFFFIYFQEHVWSVMHVSLYRILTHMLVFVLTFCYFVWTNLSFFPFPRLGNVIQQPFLFKRREPAENF